MRIISGTHKGRRITAPKNLPVRPTTDMAKEALFNILNNNYSFENLSILDLYSGTGNISFEFASRGAAYIVCVDQDYRCAKFIAETSEALHMQLQVIKSDVLKYLEKVDAKFDIIFADPPYDFAIETFEQIGSLILKKNMLSDEGILIMEHSKHTDLSSILGFTEKRTYGSSCFSFFKPGSLEE